MADNLLDKASILLTPTAYNDGSMLSIKPENGDGDFTFSRSSSATRVGEDGYIQNMPTTEELGGELVQNGDFEEIGSELVTNGSFDTDSDWTLASGATISNSVLNFNQVAAGDGAYQPSTLTSLTVRKVVVVCSEYTSGSMQVRVGTTSNPERIVGVGTYTYYLRYAGYDYVNLFINAEFTGVISSVSVKEVGQNWEFGYGWNIEDDGGNLKAISGTSTSRFISDATLVSGKKYQFSLSTSSGSASNYRVALKFNGTNTNIGVVSSDGSHEFIVQADSTSFRLQTVSTTTTSFLVDNISVKEITDVSNLPRIDYTDGCGVWLLEPQSTNLVTYSSDFSQSFYNKDSGVSVGSSNNTSPSGELNATQINVTDNGRIYVNMSSLTYYSSVFIKAGTFSYFKFTGVNVDLVSETIVNGKIESYGNGWFRISVPYTGNRPFQIQAYPDATYSSHTTSGSYYIWGAQSEQQSYATSYIPTNGAANTRLQDIANNSGNSSLINSTEGVLYAEIAALANDGTFRIISLTDGSTSNRVSLIYKTRNNSFRIMVLSGSTVFDKHHTVTSTLDFHKVAIKYKANDFAVWIDGVEVATDTSGAAPIGLSKLSFDSGTGGNKFNGKVKALAVYKEALTDAELQSLTTQ
jgi:hypothetical protein